MPKKADAEPPKKFVVATGTAISQIKKTVVPETKTKKAGGGTKGKSYNLKINKVGTDRFKDAEEKLKENTMSKEERRAANIESGLPDDDALCLIDSDEENGGGTGKNNKTQTESEHEDNDEAHCEDSDNFKATPVKKSSAVKSSAFSSSDELKKAVKNTRSRTRAASSVAIRVSSTKKMVTDEDDDVEEDDGKNSAQDEDYDDGGKATAATGVAGSSQAPEEKKTDAAALDQDDLDDLFDTCDSPNKMSPEKRSRPHSPLNEPPSAEKRQKIDDADIELKESKVNQSNPGAALEEAFEDLSDDDVNMDNEQKQDEPVEQPEDDDIEECQVTVHEPAAPAKQTLPESTMVEDIQALDDSSEPITVTEVKATPVKPVFEERVTALPGNTHKKTARSAAKKKDITHGWYCPLNDAPYNPGEPMPFSFVCNALDIIERTEGKGTHAVIVDVIANVFRTAIVNSPRDLPDLFYFFNTKLLPDFQEDGDPHVGVDILTKAIARSAGMQAKEVRELNKIEGDLGSVVSKHRRKQPTLMFAKVVQQKVMTLSTVMQQMRRLPKFTGDGSTVSKEHCIARLFMDCSDAECKYIVRFLQHTLKTGAAINTNIEALAKAIVNTPPNKIIERTEDGIVGELDTRHKHGYARFDRVTHKVEEDIKGAFCQFPHFGLVCESLLQCGDDTKKLAESCSIRPGIPIRPMLAKAMQKELTEVLSKIEDDACLHGLGHDGIVLSAEYKYDGFRAQIHYERSESGNNHYLQLFSRNLENFTKAYPDVLGELLAEFASNKQLKNCILDSELVPMDRDNGKILPFQTISGRSRKHIKDKDLKTKLNVFCFDILYLNGESFLTHQLHARQEIWHKWFQPRQNDCLQWASGQQLRVTDDRIMQMMMKDALSIGAEGLMLKALYGNDSKYEANKRSQAWIKLKKDYGFGGKEISAIPDSFDLVACGADRGTGRNAVFYASFLMACFDRDSGRFQATCKVGSGFTDDKYAELREWVEENKQPRPSKLLDKGDIDCEVWLEPTKVWEVRAADLTLSPNYKAAAGLVDPSDFDKGLSLRFGRFIRERTDKSITDATTSEQFCEAYRNQATIINEDNKN